MAQFQGMAAGAVDAARDVLAPQAAGALSPAGLRLLTTLLSFAGLLLLLISLRPFAADTLMNDPSAGSNSGDTLNQIGFLAAGGLYAIALAMFTSRRMLFSLLTPGWLMLMAVLGLSILRAPDPMATARALILTVIGMLIAFSILALPRGERDFRLALVSAAILILAICYGGVAAIPHLATHGYDAFEPQHSGLWRGSFPHKNVAGPVMSVVAIFGLYAFRAGRRLSGLLIFTAAFLFMLKTGSKTTAGFLPLAILIVMSAKLFGRSWAVIFIHGLAFAAAFTMTIGSLWNQEISQFVGELLGDATFTGRTTLWEFGLANIPLKPWFGFGYENFWGTETVIGLDKPIEADWDFRYIVHGHNSFIDILLNLGVIGGGVFIWVFYIAPLINYVRARRRPGNLLLADMFMMVIVFLTLLSLLETFFLRRVDPIWLMHAFAVFGLHLLARFDISPPASANAWRPCPRG